MAPTVVAAELGTHKGRPGERLGWISAQEGHLGRVPLARHLRPDITQVPALQGGKLLDECPASVHIDAAPSKHRAGKVSDPIDTGGSEHPPGLRRRRWEARVRSESTPR